MSKSIEMRLQVQSKGPSHQIVLGNKSDSYGKNGLEDVIPHLAGDAETKLEVLVVVRKVVFLHLPQVCR